MNRHAPLYRDSERFCSWLCQHFADSPNLLAQHLLRNALALRDHLVLALYNRERDDNLPAADDRLLLLRAQLRLCAKSGLLNQNQLLFALREADAMGKQIGAWQRARDMQN